MTSKMIAAELGRTGLCICPNFLSPRSLNLTLNDFEKLHVEGVFGQGGVGRGALRHQELEVRNTQTYWLDRALCNSTQLLLLRKLDLLKYALNRVLFLGLNDFEGHYAAYPAGGYYRRHKDCFRADSMRVVSFVLYLNLGWQAEDGGRLRVYRDFAGEESHIDVDPIGGTMVCFLSSESEHEVLVSQRRRLSLTGWFRRRPH